MSQYLLCQVAGYSRNPKQRGDILQLHLESAPALTDVVGMVCSFPRFCITSFLRWTQGYPHGSLGAGGLWHGEAPWMLLDSRADLKGKILYLWKQNLGMLAMQRTILAFSLALPLYFTDVSLVLRLLSKSSLLQYNLYWFCTGYKTVLYSRQVYPSLNFRLRFKNLQKTQVNSVRKVQRNSFVWTLAWLSE